ncbi:hypothetical protein BDZ89DRAFT_1063643, partial [Hymenopellis radicata]
MFSHLEGTNVKRLDNKCVVHLPAIEFLRVNLANVLKLHVALKLLVPQYPTMFPNLKHLEVVVNRPFDLGVLFRDVLQPVALRLESFRLELMPVHVLDDLPIYEDLFEGLHFKHFKLRNGGTDTHQLALSMLLHLANSHTTVHFVEFTFTFVEIDDVEGVSAEWATLDEVLSHAAFTGVRRIHFEEDSNER